MDWYYSYDGGATWTNQMGSLGSTTMFKGVYFVNSTTGWVVGENGTILKTTTGGQAGS